MGYSAYFIIYGFSIFSHETSFLLACICFLVH